MTVLFSQEMLLAPSQCWNFPVFFSSSSFVTSINNFIGVLWGHVDAFTRQKSPSHWRWFKFKNTFLTFRSYMTFHFCLLDFRFNLLLWGSTTYSITKRDSKSYQLSWKFMKKQRILNFMEWQTIWVTLQIIIPYFYPREKGAWQTKPL